MWPAFLSEKCSVNIDWAEYVELLEEEKLTPTEETKVYQPHRDNIALLYGHCLITQLKLVKFVKAFSRLTSGTYFIEKGVKSLYRIKEKMSFYVGTQYESNDPQIIWDYCRGMITYGTLSLVHSALVRLKNKSYHPTINVFNVWNRFTVEGNGRWQDVMCHFVFLDYDSNSRVICELQLCYEGYTFARKNRGGHDAYSEYRNAMEIERCVNMRVEGEQLES